jgi:P-type E1-E2 ATPase
VHLETLGRIDTVVLDKTGTLTLGRPDVQRIVPVAGVAPEVLLAAGAAAELRSEHPLGKAIVAYARKTGCNVAEAADFTYTPGRGITANLDGHIILVGSPLWMADNGIVVSATCGQEAEAGAEVFVARDRQLLGSIIVADTIRREAGHAIASLHRMGLRTVLLSGDMHRVAVAVGSKLGIEEIEAELLPEQKLSRIRELVAQKRVVAMVGDGINDAPALAEANVGIAMGSGTDVAQESSDVVLLGNDLARLVETLAVAKRTRGIIWQNFTGTLAVDTIGIALAAIGVLGPLLAAFIHVSSELVFILNSARLLPKKAVNR